MSEPSPLQDGTPNNSPVLSFDDVVRFFKANNVNSLCNVCGHDFHEVTVSLSLHDSHLVPSIPINIDETTGGAVFAGGSFSIKVVAVGCARCGNTRFHSRDIILQWLEKNPKPAQEGNA